MSHCSCAFLQRCVRVNHCSVCPTIQQSLYVLPELFQFPCTSCPNAGAPTFVLLFGRRGIYGINQQWQQLMGGVITDGASIQARGSETSCCQRFGIGRCYRDMQPAELSEWSSYTSMLNRRGCQRIFCPHPSSREGLRVLITLKMLAQLILWELCQYVVLHMIPSFPGFNSLRFAGWPRR